jgi:hypothetical protein
MPATLLLRILPVSWRTSDGVALGGKRRCHGACCREPLPDCSAPGDDVARSGRMNSREIRFSIIK